MRFPIVCYDNFYNNPDFIRDFALDLSYSSQGGVHPHVRTKCLSSIDPNLHYKCVQKFLSLYGIDEVPGMQWYADCIFQKGWRFNSDINDPVNQGWIHDDGQTILAGIVYLTPDAPLNTGTSFYKQIKELDDWEREDDESHDKKVFYDVLGSDTENLQSPRSNIDSINQYRENIKGHSSCYESVMECKNVYNRLLAYDGSVTHGQTNYWMNNDDDFRLIQLFFISKLILPDMKLPKNRCNNYAI